MANQKSKYEDVMDDPAVREAAQRVVDETPPLTTAQIADRRILFWVDSGLIDRKLREA